VSALVANKGVDLIVDAFNESRRPLRIIGKGPMERELKRRARSNIEFLGWVSDEDLPSEYRRCRALVHGAVEDFGIAPLEAAAAGKPTIALGRGGVLDSIVPLGSEEAPTGVFFAERTAASLLQALDAFEAAEGEFDAEALHAHARGFDESVTRERLRSFVEQAWRAHHGAADERVAAESGDSSALRPRAQEAGLAR
jgi:glycosyltransferase involved in cell wall biosynthesis